MEVKKKTQKFIKRKNAHFVLLLVRYFYSYHLGHDYDMSKLTMWTSFRYKCVMSK